MIWKIKQKTNKKHELKFSVKKYHFLILLCLELIIGNISIPLYRRSKIIKSLADKNVYHTKTLKNGIEVIMIVNEMTIKPACAITIRTGSYNDTLPGIAHFLEHMFFQGSKLTENDVSFEKYVSQNHGWSNGRTGTDKTTYYFDIVYDKFIDALILFADFLKNPSFDLNSVKSVLCEVDNEYLYRITMFNRKIDQLKQYFSKKPFNNFINGNKQTLLIEENVEDNCKYKQLQKKVIEFWKENYDSKTMKLVVYHDKNILDIISEHFETIPSITIKNTLPVVKMDYYDKNFIRRLFIPEFLNKYIYVKSLNNSERIEITIEIPNARFSFKNNVLKYFKYKFLSRNKESLLFAYKKLGFAKVLAIDFYKNLYVCSLKIKFFLTESGSDNIENVINMFYNHLHDFSYSKKEFYLYKKKFQKEFKYRENSKGINLVVDMAHNMQYYPLKNVLNYDNIFRHFDDHEMNELLNIIKKYDNWLVFIIKKEILKGEQKVETEFFYKANYFVSDKLIFNKKPQDLSIKQNNISPRLNFLKQIGESLPPKLTASKYHLVNETKKGLISFLKNTFWNKPNSKIFKLKDEANEIKLIEKGNEYSQFTFIYEPSYNIPQSYVSVKFNTKITKENYIIFHLYLQMVNEEFQEKYSDYSDFSTVNLRFEISKTGIKFEFSGFSKNIIICIYNFFKTFFNINYDYFELAKTYSIKTFDEVNTKSSENIVLNILENEIYNFLPSSNYFLEEKKRLKPEDVTLNNKYYLQMFTCSDTIHENFLALFDYLYSKIIPTKKFTHQHKITEKELKYTSLDKNNNAVGIFLKNEAISNKKSLSISNMILTCYQQKFYEKIRTKDMLAYIVGMSEEYINGIHYISFIVISKLDCDEITLKITEFIDNIKEDLHKLDIKTFKQMKKSHLTRFDCDYISLKQMYDHLNFLYYNDAFEMNYFENMTSEAQSITKDDMKLSEKMITIKLKKADA